MKSAEGESAAQPESALVHQLEREREGAEAARRASEGRYQSLFNSINEGFCIIEVLFGEDGKANDYRFLEVNAAFEKHTGLANAVGKRVREMVPNQDAHWFETFGAVALTGEPQSFATAGVALGRFYEVYAFRVGGPREHKVAVLFSDTTERKRAQDMLRDKEEQLRKLADNLPDSAVYQYTRKPGETVGRFTYLSAGIEKITGVKVQEGLADPGRLHGLIPPEHLERLMQEEARCVSELADFDIEVPMRRTDGELRWMSIRSRPRRLPDGTVVWDGVQTDITERKRAEAALQKSQARQTFLLKLSDSLRPLEHSTHVQEEAARVLGEHLSANRVAYFELSGTDYVVQRDYANRVPHIRGRFPIAAFGPRLLDAYEAGRTVVVHDVQTEASLAPEDRAAYAAIQLGAHVGVPLVKGGRLVAGLAVHAQKRRNWTAEEVELIEETAERTWAAVARARAEEALRLSEEDYRTLFTSIDEGFCVIQMLFDEQGKPNDWRFLQVNPAFERHNGLVQAVGKRIREVTPGIEEKWFEIYGKVAFTGEAIRFVESSEALNRWFDLYAFRVGEPREHKVAVLFTDITERKLTERALRERDERFGTLLANLESGVALVDEHGSFVLYNDSFLRIFGLPSEIANLNHQDWGRWQVFSEDGRLLELAEHPVRKAALSAKPVRNQLVRIKRPSDGAEVWLLVSAEPVLKPGGGLGVVICTYYDITERKKTEAELAKYRDELEQLVVERTAKLQELVGELEHFSYTITHDLKAPLRAMRGFAEVAREASDQSEARPFLEKISTAAERMDLLIRDALNYSQAVRRELPLDDVDIGPLLRGILDSYPQFQPWKAQIRVEGPLPVVLGNEAGLTQCFSNLLGNAVKFVRPDQMPRVRVWAEVLPDRDGTVRLWVEDNGIGIPRALLPKVFDMFSRGNKEYEGTGIGLALVRKVVQRMGGRVGVESEEGKGSRFWMELRPGRVVQPGTEHFSYRKVEHDGSTVLYVEDEENDAMFMQRAFAAKGMESALQVVSDGHAAIEYLSGAGKYADRKKYPMPSAVLLDLNLPLLSGFGVLEWMRNHPDFSHTPVVIFSSSTLEGDRSKARQLGANDFLAKPSSGLEFGRVVDDLKGKWMP